MIPDSHADFVFSVAGEEYGIFLCMIIMAIFAFIVLRGLSVALKEHDDFTRYSVAGLVTVFGFQSVINMGVNLQLMPEVETVFMTPSENFQFVSATLVREIATMGGDVAQFVSPIVHQRLQAKLAARVKGA